MNRDTRRNPSRTRFRARTRSVGSNSTSHTPAPSEYSHEFVWDVTREADGPFVTDVDGNVLLDFTCHIGAARSATTTRRWSRSCASSTSSSR